MESSGMGRGRGRGRPLQSVQPVTNAPVTPPPAVPQREEKRETQEEAFERMYSSVQNVGVGDSDRGRSRGRGAGRGRVLEPGRGPGLPILTRGLEQQLEEVMTIEDSARGDTDDSAKKAVEATLELEDSPPTVRVPVSILSTVPNMPEEVNGTQKVSGPSQDQGSLHSSNQPNVIEEPEEAIISRIGGGGAAIGLQTNYLRLKLLEGHPGVVEYNVTFEPRNDNVRWRRKVLYTKECEQILGTVRSFDGMILFLPYILPNDVTFIETRLDGEPDQVIKVSIMYSKVRPMRDAVVFYNILLKHIMRVLEYTEMRRQFYDLNMINTFAQHKLEIWPGLNLSTENQEGGLMICVDTCSKVLRQDTVYDFLKLMKGDPHVMKKFNEFIINKIVITKYNNKCYKIDDVRWDMNPGTTFPYRGREITFVDYLKTKHALRDDAIGEDDMWQPMLISKLKPRKNDRFAQEERLAALVPQCCHITGLTEDQRANFKVMTDLAASTRLTPVQRITGLREFIKRLLDNNDVVKILSDWGLRIERELIQVTGRRVDGPTLEFSTRMSLKAAGPDFSREAGKAVIEPIPVKDYILLCTQRDAVSAKRFMETYQQVSTPLGIKMIRNGNIVILKGNRPADFSDALKANCDPDKVQFVVIIMPQQRDDVYSAIKRFCVANVPIPSQCIVSKTLQNEKRLRSIVLKIALQINCKLGGSLWALQIPLAAREKYMFIGIDAAHDPLKKDPSVICLVASLNNQCTKYFSISASSRVHQELGESLGSLTKAALLEYRKMNNCFPERIIVFRDGGSIGAIDVIWTTEMNQMKRAVKETCGELKKFSFVLVTKRISQRFFACKSGTAAPENPAPGTIVDSTVTRRYLYDYYVVSQLVRQGTVNPTHFVLIDSTDPIKPELIQRLSYVTCFMYYNWSGTVRVPAMVQYAHKLSALLIRHVKADPHRDIATTLYYL